MRLDVSIRWMEPYIVPGPARTCPLGRRLDLLRDRVAVPLPLGEREEDVEDDRSEREVGGRVESGHGVHYIRCGYNAQDSTSIATSARRRGRVASCSSSWLRAGVRGLSAPSR